MTQTDLDPFDIASNVVLLEYSSFYAYIDTISDFLQQREQEIKLQEKGEEASYDEYIEMLLPKFKATLFSSFFISIYGYLETNLTNHCKDVKEKFKYDLSVSDLSGRGVQKHMKYLVKVHKIQYPPEWEKIKKLNLLRNCITHNQGQVQGCNDSDKVIDFVQEHPFLEIHDGYVVLTKEFCNDAIEIVFSFIHSIMIKPTYSK